MLRLNCASTARTFVVNSATLVFVRQLHKLLDLLLCERLRDQAEDLTQHAQVDPASVVSVKFLKQKFNPKMLQF